MIAYVEFALLGAGFLLFSAGIYILLKIVREYSDWLSDMPIKGIVTCIVCNNNIGKKRKGYSEFMCDKCFKQVKNIEEELEK